MDSGPKKHGFTLVENVVAVLLLTIGLAGAWVLMGSLLRGNAFSSQMTHATTLAEDKIEDLRQTGYDGLSSGSDAVDGYTRTWTVGVGPIVNTKKIDVVVAWTDTDNHPHSSVMKSIIGK